MWAFCTVQGASTSSEVSPVLRARRRTVQGKLQSSGRHLPVRIVNGRSGPAPDEAGFLFGRRLITSTGYTGDMKSHGAGGAACKRWVGVVDHQAKDHLLSGKVSIDRFASRPVPRPPGHANTESYFATMHSGAVEAEHLLRHGAAGDESEPVARIVSEDAHRSDLTRPSTKRAGFAEIAYVVGVPKAGAIDAQAGLTKLVELRYSRLL